MKTKTLVMHALVAGIYTALCIVLGAYAFGPVQIRIAELLMVLCIFDKKFIYSLTFACFVTNIYGVMNGMDYFMLDIIFGTLATLLSGILMYKLRNIRYKGLPLLSFVMPAIFNGIIVGAELTYYFMAEGSNVLMLFGVNALSVFAGEMISVFILGIVFFKPFERFYQLQLNK